jgi:hypothetical protein
MHRVAAGFLAAGLLAVTLAVSSGAAGSAVSPREKAQARQALLVLSDFPKGWKSAPNVNFSTSDIGGDVHMARCLGVSPSSLEFNPPEVQSPTFTDLAGEAFVEDSILVFRSTSFARNEYASLTSPKTASCLQAQVAAQESTVTTLAPPPHVSLEKLPAPKGSVSYAVSYAPPGSENGSASPALVISFFTHGQFGDLVTAASVGTGTDVRPLAQRLLNVARSRL